MGLFQAYIAEGCGFTQRIEKHVAHQGVDVTIQQLENTFEIFLAVYGESRGYDPIYEHVGQVIQSWCNVCRLDAWECDD